MDPVAIICRFYTTGDGRTALGRARFDKDVDDGPLRALAHTLFVEPLMPVPLTGGHAMKTMIGNASVHELLLRGRSRALPCPAVPDTVSASFEACKVAMALDWHLIHTKTAAVAESRAVDISLCAAEDVSATDASAFSVELMSSYLSTVVGKSYDTVSEQICKAARDHPVMRKRMEAVVACTRVVDSTMHCTCSPPVSTPIAIDYTHLSIARKIRPDDCIGPAKASIGPISVGAVCHACALVHGAVSGLSVVARLFNNSPPERRDIEAHHVLAVVHQFLWAVAMSTAEPRVCAYVRALLDSMCKQWCCATGEMLKHGSSARACNARGCPVGSASAMPVLMAMYMAIRVKAIHDPAGGHPSHYAHNRSWPFNPVEARRFLSAAAYCHTFLDVVTGCDPVKSVAALRVILSSPVLVIGADALRYSNGAISSMEDMLSMICNIGIRTPARVPETDDIQCLVDANVFDDKLRGSHLLVGFDSGRWEPLSAFMFAHRDISMTFTCPGHPGGVEVSERALCFSVRPYPHSVKVVGVVNPFFGASFNVYGTGTSIGTAIALFPDFVVSGIDKMPPVPLCPDVSARRVRRPFMRDSADDLRVDFLSILDAACVASVDTFNRGMARAIGIGGVSRICVDASPDRVSRPGGLIVSQCYIGSMFDCYRREIDRAAILASMVRYGIGGVGVFCSPVVTMLCIPMVSGYTNLVYTMVNHARNADAGGQLRAHDFVPIYCIGYPPEGIASARNRCLAAPSATSGGADVVVVDGSRCESPGSGHGCVHCTLYLGPCRFSASATKSTKVRFM